MKRLFLHLSLFCTALLAVPGCVQTVAPVVPGLVLAEQLSLEGVDNLHRVSSELYRSAQPTPLGFSSLQAQGVRSVLNLREYHNDDWRAAHTNLKLMEYPMAASRVTEQDVENCLRMIAEAPKPVLVHCWHGSDRTGIIVAAWRVVFGNRTVEEAEAEFRTERYGYHDFWYSNLTDLLRNTDWDAMRARLQAKK